MLAGKFHKAMKSPVHRLIFGYALALLTCSTQAQAYRPLVVEGNRWGEYYQFEGASWWVYQLQGDTVVNGTTWKKLHTAGIPAGDVTCFLLMREDTATRKVFGRLDLENEALL
jgi:hypothetical protein